MIGGSSPRTPAQGPSPWTRSAAMPGGRSPRTPAQGPSPWTRSARLTDVRRSRVPRPSCSLVACRPGPHSRHSSVAACFGAHWPCISSTPGAAAGSGPRTPELRPGLFALPISSASFDGWSVSGRVGVARQPKRGAAGCAVRRRPWHNLRHRLPHRAVRTRQLEPPSTRRQRCGNDCPGG